MSLKPELAPLCVSVDAAGSLHTLHAPPLKGFKLNAGAVSTGGVTAPLICLPACLPGAGYF